MTSVMETALEIYNDAQERAKQIARKDHIQCDLRISSLSFLDNKIRMKDNSLVLDTNDRAVTANSHIVARYLIANVRWDKELTDINIGIPTEVSSLNIAESYVRRLNPLGWWYSEKGPEIPYGSVDVLDTVLALIAGRKPKLKDFRPKALFKGHEEVEADIRELPEIPTYQPSIEHKEFKIPIERIIERVEKFRKRAIERHKNAKREIETLTGEKPTSLSCGTEQVKFYKDNGIELLGKVEQPHRVESFRPLLSTATVNFSNPLDLVRVGYLLGGQFQLELEKGGSSVSQEMDEYMHANSLLDFKGVSVREVEYDKFSIKKNHIGGIYGVKKGRLKEILQLVEKLVSLS